MKKILSLFLFIAMSLVGLLYMTCCSNSSLIESNISPDNSTNSLIPKYTITWKNWDGTVLEIDTDVEKEQIPSYDSETPIRPSDSSGQYVFIGWDKKISPVKNDIEYIAMYEFVNNTVYLVSFNSNGGTAVSSQNILKGEKVHKPANPTREGYTFDDWYYQGERWSFVGYTVTEDMTLEARWSINSYRLDLKINNSKAGNISPASGAYLYNKSITITAITNPGYTFKGWYNGDSLLTNNSTYKFNMPSNNLSYTAKYEVDSHTPYKVEHYCQNLEDNQYTLCDTDELFGITDTLTHGQVKTYDGFTSPTISQTNINGDGSTVIKLYYARKTYTVNLSTNDSKAGNIKGIGVYKCGAQVTIEAVPNLGYKFLGWYEDDTEITKENFYIIDSLSQNVNYEARFELLHEMENFYFSSTIDNCTISGLKSKNIVVLDVPNFVTSIDKGAFSGCSSLERIVLPFIGDQRHKGNDKNQYPLGYVFGQSSYTGASSINQYFYSSSLDNITFTTYYIPDTLKEVILEDCECITKGAFYNCSKLKIIGIPGKINHIYDEFTNCSSLDTIYYFGTVEQWCSIHFDTYHNNPMSRAKNFYIFDVDGDEDYNNTKYSLLTELEIPITITSIGDSQFYGFNKLTSVIIPDTVTSIGEFAFEKCNSLVSIVLPKGITSIERYTFNGCSALTSILIPEGVTTIGIYSFAYCSALTSILIPEGVTTIGTYSFAYCSSLTGITIPNSVTKFEEAAFRGCKKLISVEISKGITNIAKYAFRECESLTNIIIPEGVISIEDNAFESCSYLTNVYIPSSIKCISNAAFEGCNNLINVYYGGNLDCWCNVKFASLPSNPVSLAQYFYILDINGEVRYNDLQFNLLTNLEISNTIVSIGNYQFSGFSSITNLTIPDSVTSIGDSAFKNCSSLTSVQIPDSVVSIGSAAFSGCSSIVDIALPFVGDKRHSEEDIYQYTFGYVFGTESYTGGIARKQCYYASSLNKTTYATYYLPIKLKTITITDCEYIPYGAFYACDFTNITLPNNLMVIGDSAFYNCRSLESMIIPYGVISIRGSAFYNCENLASIIIPDSVTSIGGHAFWNCSSLSNVTLPTGITNIEAGTFYNCTGLTQLTVLGVLTSIETRAFYGCSKIKDFIIHKEITYIGSYAFYDCKSLNNVYYNGTINEWCNFEFTAPSTNPMSFASNFFVMDSDGDVEYAGNKYSLLTQLELPYLLSSIGDYQFYGFSCITQVIIPNSVTNIGEMAFAMCSNLTNIIVPDSVITIGDSAFSGCSSLESIQLPFVGDKRHNSDDTCQYTFGYIFGSVSYIGATGATQYYYEESLSNTTSITYYLPASLEEVVITDSTYIQYGAFRNCVELKRIILPDNLISIGDYAFYNCNSVSNMVIPDNVTSIGSNTFCYCRGLTNVSISKNTISIGDYTFAYCSGMSSITIPDNILSIGKYAFSHCSLLASITLSEHIISIGDGVFYDCKSLTDVKFFSPVTSIGDYTFEECTNLTNVIIMDSITSIGVKAFYHCTKLANIYYGGTPSSWESVTIGDNNTSISSLSLCYYTETEPVESGNYWHYVEGEPQRWN